MIVKANKGLRERTAKRGFRLDDYPFISMADILFRINQNLLIALRPSGISIPMWRVLATLQETDGLTLGQLSSKILVERSALSRVIDLMEESGLVRRQIHGKDRRYTRVLLCKKGRERFEQILPMAKGQIDWALQGLNKQKLMAIQTILDRIIGNFDSFANVSQRPSAQRHRA